MSPRSMSPRCFAIVPAAGESLRMGQPKLLLPLNGEPLLATTLRAWRRSGVQGVLVVVRPEDLALAHAAREAGGELVIPENSPPDMKASIQAALRYIERNYAPNSSDAFLVAPADMPRLSAAMVNRLISLHELGQEMQILLPELAGQRGHPVLFPWPFARQVFELEAHQGLNSLVDRSQPRRVPCDDLADFSNNPFLDVDTPDDYARLTSNE